MPNVNEKGFSPKNLLSRVFAEMGLLGLLPVIISLLWVFNKIVKQDRRTFGVLVCIILLITNFDNLFHIYPLMLFCWLLNIPKSLPLKNIV